jgi:hypothetical protein
LVEHFCDARAISTALSDHFSAEKRLNVAFFGDMGVDVGGELIGLAGVASVALRPFASATEAAQTASFPSLALVPSCYADIVSKLEDTSKLAAATNHVQLQNFVATLRRSVQRRFPTFSCRRILLCELQHFQASATCLLIS